MEEEKLSFSERVLQLALAIPKGKVTTYGRLTTAAGGAPILAQSITSILSKTSSGVRRKIPYHRIVYSDGRVWLDFETKEDRLFLYKKEGIKLDHKNRIIDFEKKLIY